MADSGNPTQWGDSYPPQEMLEEDIDSNRLFIYTVNARLEVVFAFILGPDPTYAKIEDGQWLNDEVPYGTIHRLASTGDRRGVASEVIAWCLEHCESLRADTHADNKIMQHVAMQMVGVGFIIGVIQDSVETALNSAGDVEFAATAEYHQWLKQGKPLPDFLRK